MKGDYIYVSAVGEKSDPSKEESWIDSNRLVARLMFGRYEVSIGFDLDVIKRNGLYTTDKPHGGRRKGIDLKDGGDIVYGIGEGSNTVFTLCDDDNFLFSRMRYWISGKSDEAVRPEKDPRFFVVLAHELIHSDRIARGDSVGTGGTSKGYGKDFYYDTISEEYRVSLCEDIEEMETIGISITNKKNDITENSIRKEHKMPLRRTGVPLYSRDVVVNGENKNDLVSTIKIWEQNEMNMRKSILEEWETAFMARTARSVIPR
jgi:hypothetical protein